MTDEPMTLRELDRFSDVSLRVIWDETCNELGVHQDPPDDRKEVTVRLFQLSKLLENKRAKDAKRKRAADRKAEVRRAEKAEADDAMIARVDSAKAARPAPRSSSRAKPLPAEDQAAIRAALNSVFDTFPPMPLAGFDQ